MQGVDACLLVTPSPTLYQNRRVTTHCDYCELLLITGLLEVSVITLTVDKTTTIIEPLDTPAYGGHDTGHSAEKLETETPVLPDHNCKKTG